MGKYENTRGMTDREKAEVEKAFRQVTNSASTQKVGGTGKTTAKASAARKQAEQKRKILIISVCAVILVVLIGLIVGMIAWSNRDTDDGRILKNVCAAGVNLGGMTKEEASSALHLATDKTFSRKDMVIKLADSGFSLSPADTGAVLDVDAVVEAAFNYGRTGTEAEQLQAQQNAATNIHTIALLPYLNLNLPFIQNAVMDFCDSYSSTMTQPVVKVTGERPVYDAENPDKKVSHQTLTITMGTPDYALDADDLYDRVLDAYSLNEMDVTYQAPTQAEPEVPNAAMLFTEHCVAPVDAVMDPVTYEVTPEVYGYGFDILKLQEMIEEAEYGETIEVTLGFLMPDITAKDLSEGLFLDKLSSCTVSNTEGNSANRNTNLKLSCEAINGTVLKAGEEFSFNDILGRPTAQKGYKKAAVMVNGEMTDVLGGGIDQTASALYYCALMADLDIQERHCHDYAVSYIELGMDANISWGDEDLCFRNNTGSPLRIIATSDGNSVSIELLGTNELDYDVQITFEITKKKNPLTVTQTMDKNNVMGYKEGDVLQSGIVGYEVETHIHKYDQETGELIVSSVVDTSSYNKRDEIVVKIESNPVVKPTEPTEEPTDPTEATEPTTEPTDATEPVETTEPEENTDPVEESIEAPLAA